MCRFGQAKESTDGVMRQANGDNKILPALSYQPKQYQSSTPETSYAYYTDNSTALRRANHDNRNAHQRRLGGRIQLFDSKSRSVLGRGR